MEHVTSAAVFPFLGSSDSTDNSMFDEIQLGMESPVMRDEFLQQTFEGDAASAAATSAVTAAAASVSDEENQSIVIDYIVSNFVVPAICIFGLIGNTLNLIVLTREQLRCSLKPMERSVNTGFVALALSDVLFCLFYLLDLFTHKTPADGVYASMFKVYYKTYKELILNIFLLTSTWLTVVMAVGRYVAVCRPIEARGFIKPRGTQIAIGLVFGGSLLVNMPRFWHYYVDERPCPLHNDTQSTWSNTSTCSPYVKMAGSLYLNRTFRLIYNVVLSTVGIFIPLLVLVVCNICLIRALRRSYAMQRLYRGSDAKDSGQRITPTLIALIVLFVILVGPSEMLTFINLQGSSISLRRLLQNSRTSYYRYRIATVVTNCLLLLNFAFNVVLYCTLNTQFRRVVKTMFCFVVGERRGVTSQVSAGGVTRHHTTVCSQDAELDAKVMDVSQRETQQQQPGGARVQATVCLDYTQRSIGGDTTVCSQAIV